MHKFRPNIKNTNGVSIPTGIFLDEGNSTISGLLYSKVGLQYLYSFPNRKLAEEFIFIHNPLATNKLPKPWLKVGQEYWIDDDNEWLIKFNHEKGIEEKRFKVYLVNETWNLIDMVTNTDY